MVVSNSEFFALPEAHDLVDDISAELSSSNELAIITTKRKQGFAPQLVRFALEQALLRSRAQKKFPSDAGQMLFTEAGLEQATRAEVAKWHAKLFLEAGVKSVTDLGCGIGGDAMALAATGLDVTAIDSNETAVAAATHNLRYFPEARVIRSEAKEVVIESTGIFLDPARRDQLRKSAGPVRLQPEDFSPSLDFVFGLAAEYPALVKLAPGFPHELIPDQFETNWVSHAGDLVEVLLRSKQLGTPGAKKAVMLGTEVHEFAGVAATGQVRELGGFLFEPDPSLIRSHLLGTFANQHDLGLISNGIAYLTADTDNTSPWLKRYRVIDTLPLREKEIRDYCQRENIGTVEIKKRGVDITPEQLRPKLRLKGTGVATLVLTKVGDARQAIVCEPIR